MPDYTSKARFPMEEYLKIMGNRPGQASLLATGLDSAQNGLATGMAISDQMDKVAKRRKRAEVMESLFKTSEWQKIESEQPGATAVMSNSDKPEDVFKIIVDNKVKNTNVPLFKENIAGKVFDVASGNEVTSLPKEHEIVKEGNTRTYEQSDKMLLGGIVKTFNADPVVKKSWQSINAAKQIQDLVLSGNPIEANSVPTYAARMSGEVGNLSEPDKKPFGGSVALHQQIKQFFTNKILGTLTEDNKKFMLELTDVIIKRSKENYKDLAQNMASQYGASMQRDPKEIYNMLNEFKDDVVVKPTVSQNATQAVPVVGGVLNGKKIKSVTEIK